MITRPDSMNLLALAVDADIRGFAALERVVHPVEELISGPVRYLRWPGEGRRGDEFSEEFFPVDLDPAAALRHIRVAKPGPDYLIAEIAATTTPQQESYLTAGYEIGSTEPLMIVELNESNSRIPKNIPIRRLTSIDETELITESHRAIGYPLRQYNQALLDDPRIIIRAVWIDDQPVSIARLAQLETTAYLTDVVTLPDFRRNGFGEAVVRQLHADALANGITHIVLTSTAMARPLYEKLGYVEVATVTIYVTPERT